MVLYGENFFRGFTSIFSKQPGSASAATFGLAAPKAGVAEAIIRGLEVSLAGDQVHKSVKFYSLLFAITLARGTVEFETIMDTLGVPRKTRKGICWLFPCLPCFPWSRSELRVLRKAFALASRYEVARYVWY